MTSRKMAFFLGFGAIGLLVAEYLLLLCLFLFVPEYRDDSEGLIETFIWVFLPALIAVAGLLIGRVNPWSAGLLEFCLGGSGVIFGIFIFVTSFSTLTTMGLVNQGLLFSIFAGGLLLATSGGAFIVSAKKKQD